MLNKKPLKEKTILCNAQYINKKTSNELSTFLLADLSQPLGYGGQQLLHFCMYALPVCGKTHSLKYEPEL
jgi:hypothetical protein